MVEISATIKGISQLAKKLSAIRDSEKRALEVAVRVEGYRLRKLMQAEIRASAPGGKTFKPLSFIARRYWRRKTKPLITLARAIRYDISKNPFAMKIGWTGRRVSKRWKYLARIHQEGFSRPITENQRKRIIEKGAWLGTVEGGDTPFFLRKTTTVFHTPARPIVAPFWARHEKEAMRNIRSNYKRKRRGKRI